jgi:peptide/nickel transport system ATP-binding protein
MKQRVVIATALFLRPKIVILDEPTTALDVIVQAQIINLLKRLKRAFDLSFIFITHDLALEAEISDRICVMYAGKIAELGANAQIYGPQGPAHPYTQMLLAATPRLHQKIESLSFIPGTPPDLIDPPSGCRFHPRCPRAYDRCREEEPPLREIEPEHRPHVGGASNERANRFRRYKSSGWKASRKISRPIKDFYSPWKG